MLCFSTSFWVLRAPKSWSKPFIQPFFFEKALKWAKKVEKRLKKRFRPACGCAQHPKAVRNTQHSIFQSSIQKHYKLHFFMLTERKNPHTPLMSVYIQTKRLLIYFTCKTQPKLPNYHRSHWKKFGAVHTPLQTSFADPFLLLT